MGPGNRGERRRRGSGESSRMREGLRSVRVGEVPTFNDSANPRLYRRLLFDWIRFQDLAEPDSKHKLSLGQQVFAIVTNVRGNAGQRMGHITELVNANMTRDEFAIVIDHVLDIVDPLDREAAFMETAGAWRDIMNKAHAGAKQSYDKYWSEYCTLCLQYAYAHGKAAQASGVQELLALLCVLNARLGRTEFNMVLQTAMAHQAKLNLKARTRINAGMPVSGRPGPQSAAEAMSATRRVARAATGETSVQGTTASPAAGSRTAEGYVQPSMIDILSEIVNLINTVRTSTMEAITVLENPTITADHRNVLGEQLNEVNRAAEAAQEHLQQARQLHLAGPGAVDESHVDVVTRGHDEKAPLMTMEAVRVALRRLDFGDDAMSEPALTKMAESPGQPPTVQKQLKCWSCGGPHYAYSNAKCAAELRLKRQAQGAGRGGRRGRGRGGGGGGGRNGPGGGAVGIIEPNLGLLAPVWAEPPDTAETLLCYARSSTDTVRSFLARINRDHGTAIVDSGATLSVLGESNYIALCEEQGVKPHIMPKQEKDDAGHAFGTSNNRSKTDEIIGRCNIPVPVGRGRYLYAHAIVVDSDVPFIIGKETLRQWKCLESHDGNWMEVDVEGSRVRLPTNISESDGHARLRIGGNDMMMNVAESMLVGVPGENSSDAREIVSRIHARTHLPPLSVEQLLKRAGKWNNNRRRQIREAHLRCRSCLRSGDPKPARKFSLSKIHLHWNERVCIDIMYWSNNMAVHAVDASTGYSELARIESRDLPKLLRKLYNVWFLRHGDPGEIMADQEFDKPQMIKWAKSKNVKFSPLPARRHNKAGIVERKNRVIKDILERLDNDASRRSLYFADKLQEAAFISNILYGGRVASAFEMARGYTPSVTGTGGALFPQSVRAAHEELMARRLIAKILRARPEKKLRDDIKIGDSVLILIPGGSRKRGQWQEAVVSNVRDDGAIVCGHGRNKRTIAPEDVRTIPSSQLAQAVVRAELEFPENEVAPTDGDDDQDEDTDGSETSSDSGTSPPVRRKLPWIVADYQQRTRDTANDHEADEGFPEPTFSGGPVRQNNDDNVAKNGTGDNIDDGEVDDLGKGDDENGVSGSVRDYEDSENNDSPTGGSTQDPGNGVMRTRAGRTVRAPSRYTTLTNPVDRENSLQYILEDVARHFGTSQFMAHEAEWIPGWIYRRAEKAELDTNWFPSLKVVHSGQVPNGSNLISSHFVYKVKLDEESRLRKYTLKARLCVHGNRDIEREALRSDAAVVSHIGFRMLYSIAASKGLLLAKADIRGAYTQSGNAMRDVYVIPPRHLGRESQVWLLTKTMYGIVSAGRKWQRASDEVLVKQLGLSQQIGVPQFFSRTFGEKNPEVVLLLAKYVDDLAIAGRNAAWVDFARQQVGKALDIGSWAATPQELAVNSTAVQQTHDGISVHIRKYVRDVTPIAIPPGRRKQIRTKLTALETRQVRTLAGKWGYAGITVSPFASFAASYTQQLLPGMEVSDLKLANSITRDLLKKDATLIYLQPSKTEQKQRRVVVFADAGFPHTGPNRAVAQEGALVGVSFGTQAGSIFHLIAWQSRKQRRVAVSSGCAETIAAVSAFGLASYVRSAIQDVTGASIPLTLAVDSRGLHRSLATQSTPRDQAMLPDVDKLRVEYEAGNISAIVWIAGTRNPADALTKAHAGETAVLLERLMVEGRLPVNVDDLRHYGPALEEEG